MQDVAHLPRRLRAAVMPPRATVFQALEAIEKSALQIALCIEEGCLLKGIVTDGDIRRLLLGGRPMSTPVSECLSEQYVKVSPDAGRVEALELMQSLRISHLPIVDDEGRFHGLHLLGELLKPNRIPNVAVIMAGGKGTRLGGITRDCPKPMLKVAGRPILERLVLNLAGHGIKRIYLAINYLGEVIERHFGDGSQLGCQIDYLREQDPLGTAGSLFLLPSSVLRDPLLVLNGDLVMDVNISELLRFHRETAARLTMGVKVYTHRVPYGCISVEGCQVLALREKPLLTETVNAGVYVLEPDLLEMIPKNEGYDMTELISSLVSRGDRVSAFDLQSDWIDIGHKEQLHTARGNPV